MAANTGAPEKLKAWRKGRKLTLEEAGELVKATSTAWFEWERGENIPAVHTTVDIQKETDGRVTVEDWARLSRAKAEARAALRRRSKRALSASQKTGTHD